MGQAQSCGIDLGLEGRRGLHFFLFSRSFRDIVHHLGVVTHAGNLSTWGVEAGEWRV